MNEVQSLAAIFISLGWCSCCCCSMLLYRFRSRFLYIILYIIISIPLSLSPILFSLPIFIALSAFLLAGFIHTIIYCESCVFGEMSLCMRESAAALCYFDSTIHENAVAVHKNWKEITYTRLLQQQQPAKVTGRQWNCGALRIVRGEVRISQQQTTPTTSTLKTIGQRPQFLFFLL